MAFHHIFNNNNFINIIHNLDNDSNKAAQDSAQNTTSIVNGISQKEQLRTLTTGTANFTFNGAVGSFVQTKYINAPSNFAGKVTVNIAIDFGARTIGGPGSSFHVETIPVGNINDVIDMSIPISFANGTGNAVFGNLDPSDNHFFGTLTLKNVNGIIAKTATLAGTYNDGSGNEGNIPTPVVMER